MTENNIGIISQEPKQTYPQVEDRTLRDLVNQGYALTAIGLPNNSNDAISLFDNHQRRIDEVIEGIKQWISTKSQYVPGGYKFLVESVGSSFIEKILVRSINQISNTYRSLYGKPLELLYVKDYNKAA